MTHHKRTPLRPLSLSPAPRCKFHETLLENPLANPVRAHHKKTDEAHSLTDFPFQTGWLSQQSIHEREKRLLYLETKCTQLQTDLAQCQLDLLREREQCSDTIQSLRTKYEALITEMKDKLTTEALSRNFYLREFEKIEKKMKVGDRTTQQEDLNNQVAKLKLQLNEAKLRAQSESRLREQEIHRREQVQKMYDQLYAQYYEEKSRLTQTIQRLTTEAHTSMQALRARTRDKNDAPKVYQHTQLPTVDGGNGDGNRNGLSTPHDSI